MQLKCMRTLLAFSHVLFLQFVQAIYRHNLTSNSHHQLWHISEHINEYCFNPKTSVTIFADNWSRSHYQFSIKQTTLYLFGKNVKKALQKHQRFRNVYELEPVHVSLKTYPASSVTLFIDENIDLSELLTSFKNSIWWNSRAKYLLIDSGIFGCSIAETILNIAWSFNILSVIYLCRNRADQLFFYTFNPYTYFAPTFWTRVPIDAEVWTLFKNDLNQIGDWFPLDDSTVCDTLYFDKSRNMNGYNLRLYGAEGESQYEKNAISPDDRCKSANVKIVCNIIKAVNATFSVKFFNFERIIESDGQPSKSANEIFSGNLDFVLYYVFLNDYWFCGTYPFFSDQLKIVTPIYQSYEINFFAMFKPASWIFLILLAILTILLLKYALRISLVPSVLEFMRLFTGMCVLREPKRNFERFCFVILIYMWLVINIYVQSNFQANKIAINKHKAIDSLEDLVKSNFIVYGSPSVGELITNPELQRRFVREGLLSTCLDFPSSGKPSACIIAEAALYFFGTARAPIHVSMGNALERGVTWLVPQDSPLLSKFNSVISRFSQAGIIKFYHDQDKLTYQRNVFGNMHFRIREFVVAVRILFYGWLLALVIFVFEFLTGIMLLKNKSICN